MSQKVALPCASNAHYSNEQDIVVGLYAGRGHICQTKFENGK